MSSSEEESHTPARKDVKANELKKYEYDELAKTTRLFSNDKLLGRGSFGDVFKGSLPSGEVAIKKLKYRDGQWEKEFEELIKALGTVRHQNLVSLIGYCSDSSDRLLVSEFVPNKSLKFHLYDGKRRSNLNWSIRMKIAIDTAKGLAYLHKECSSKIIHGDIKAANILLDDSFKPKVAEFGLAKFYSKIDHKNHPSQKISEESDVYFFGIVLLELIMGKKVQNKDVKKIVEVLEGRKSTKELWFVNSQQDSSPYNALAPKKDNPHGPKEFEYTVLADATGKFSYAHRLGGGGFGEVFSGTLSFKKNNRENLQSSDVAIKKLAYNKDKPGKEEFEKEIKAVGIVRHRCLVSLIGYCCDEYNRLLVLEFVPNKSLRFHLHGNQQPTLEWSKRMKIAISSAKGLEYLHKGCTPPIIHRDIKADNILIDNNFESKIADFGLAKFFPETGSVTHISTILKGTNIYADPEKYPSQKLSEKSDVYSFGVVLLELLTGKDPFAGDGIVKWAMPLMIEGNDLIKDNYADLIDSKLEGHYNPSQMTRMIYCAAASVYKPSISRPMMEEIVLVLQEKMPPENLWLAKGETSRQDNQSRKPYPNELEPPTLLRTFSFEELASVTSSFSGKHLLRDDYFFQVYKGVLPDNNNQNVAIKRIKHVSEQRKDEFEEEIEAINHVRHRNIITLIGYCSDKENNRLLVFEFISDNSLKFHLHGNGSSTDLDWSKRMKIAEGLAEGLKYMHEDCKPRILHLYVKSDNIFLNKKFEPKLAEFGSAKLFPDSVTHLSIDKIMKDSGYMAPEYDSTNKHLTDKFDVYSFGVILLELITGKEPVGDLDGHTTIVDWAKRHLSKGKDSFVDDKLLMKYDTEQMDRMIACALACVHGDPQNRPQMSEILEALKGRVSL
ncbi:leucine-rich repeat receptor protein kinase EMS1 isoform X5 [Hevea brasiliensis]|uniref:leucine-rich repeat receptor protein kinase EMS1 isoform X5 n=1 Tax=Hevea brasiliensis TaxID=3981 RepID=UPI0026014E1A|nr:leucine-rich repeat receptor protein kinase EMS1 isoform X5 [Hevea brasiliensis]